MNLDLLEALDAIKTLKSWGAKRADVGGIEVEFADSASVDMTAAIENAYEQAKAEIMAMLTSEQRAALEQKMKDALTYGSS